MLVMDQNLERQDWSMIITFLLLPPSSSFLLVSPWSLEVTARDSFEPDSCPESPLVRELKTEVKVINLNERFDWDLPLGMDDHFNALCTMSTVCSVGTVRTICGQVFSNCHCSQFLEKAFFFICGLFAICSAVMLPRFFYHSLYSVC